MTTKIEYADAMYRGYIAAMLWSTSDMDDESGNTLLDENYGIEDIDDEFEAICRANILTFVATAWPWLAERDAYDDDPSDNGWEEIDPDQAGHDFWLTRAGHGVGFWDRGLGSRGDILTDKCKELGEVDVYAHDGKVVS